MKEKISKLINKNLKMILIFGIVIVVAFGMLLMLISGNHEERDQVEVTPAAEQQEEDKDKPVRKPAESNDHPGVSDTALALYNARVDNLDDTAEVAQLVEASDMRKELGGYIVTLDKKNNTTLHIAFEKQLKEGEELAFDEAATWYAEQFLALIEDADKVVWTYEVEKNQATIEAEKKAAIEKAEKEAAEKKAAEKEDESDSDSDSDEDSDKEKTEIEVTVEKYKKVEKSLTVEQADELLGTEIKGYSKSPELVQTLINNQKGIV